MYTLENRNIFSTKNGKLVAVLNEDNVPVFEPGMTPAHKTKLEAWMRENGIQFAAAPEQKHEPEKPEETEQKHEPEKPEETEEKHEPEVQAAPRVSVSDIPDCRLPHFDRKLGMDTPGLREYIACHKLDRAQAVALIRRLERKH